jgi:hypothetical protein
MQTIKVLNHPPTFIEISDDADVEQARVDWQLKYHKKILDEEQKRREAISIRQAKVMQRRNFK